MGGQPTVGAVFGGASAKVLLILSLVAAGLAANAVAPSVRGYIAVRRAVQTLARETARLGPASQRRLVRDFLRDVYATAHVVLYRSDVRIEQRDNRVHVAVRYTPTIEIPFVGSVLRPTLAVDAEATALP